MKIYFDNVLINEDYYKSLTNTHNLFNGNFILGSTASNTFTLELDVLATSTTPEVIKITDNNEDYATLVIDKIEDVDKYTKSYKLTDKLVDLNYYYDASEFINQNGGSALTSEILADMCSKIGLEVDENINWINDIPVTWYDNTILAREYAGYIAEINAGYIFILPNGKLTIKQHKMTSKYTINVDDCENFTLGERHIISKVVYDNGIVKYEAGDDTGNTLYVDANNVFIVSQDQITNIYNSIVGFEFYSVETGNCPINKDVRAGDVITFVDGDNEYPTIANIDLSYNGGWNGGYSLDINTERQEETDLIGNNTKIRGIVSRLNRDEAKLEVIATQTDDNTEEIGNLQVGFDEVKTEVSKVTNLIKETQSNNNLIIEDASANDLKSLSIKGQISLLFGNDGQTYGIVPLAEILYPSNTLFGKNMNLIVEGTEEIQTIKLPFTFLNYINNEVCDEFKIENGKASVIRRVGINSNMEKYELEQEVIEDLGELNITLFDSYNKIYLQCFDNAILSASYMVKNEYTDIFATKVELNSSIKQTSSSIIAEVNGTIDNVDKDLNAKLELKVDTENLISEINASAENVNINSNKLNLEGYTTINGNFKIDNNGDMECNNAQINGTIKGSTFKGTNDNSIYLKIGDDPNDTGSMSTNNCLQILRPDNTNMLTISSRYWGTNNSQLTFESPVRFFTFYSIIDDYRVNSNAFVADSFMYSPAYNGGSLESIKKNIKLFDKYAIDIINSADLYSYNLKKENDDDKKHIGLVIGDGEKDYNTPDEIITKDKQGIDLYSMISLSWKAIQEQQEMINKLEERIKELENEKNSNN